MSKPLIPGAATSARELQHREAHRGRGLPPPLANRGAFFLFAASCSFALAACGPARSTSTTTPKPAAEAKYGGPWTAPLRADHPLVGRIWSPAKKTFLDAQAFEDEAFAARFVLLGEKHDAPDHHRLQKAVIESLVKRGRKPSVVFEMLDVDEQPRLDAARAAKDPEQAAFTPGWDWPLYKPIVTYAFDVGLPVFAGNYPKAKIKASFHGTPIAEEDLHALGVDLPFPAEATASLEQELVDSHCGHLPKGHVGGFVTAQRLRDGQLAERMVATATDGGAVLVAGGGHARNDRGVPWVLAQLPKSKGQKVFSIGFVEVQTGMNEPDAYKALYSHAGAASLPFDAVWFTPALDDEDPCAGMK